MPPRRPRLLIVIPCLNEEEALPKTLARLKEHVAALKADTEIVVIDDGSLDRTAHIARKVGVRVVELSRNLGIGGAVQTGLKIAQREGFDCALQLDGDGQHPPEEVNKLLARLEEKPTADLVIGSRFLGHDGWKSTLMRRAGIRWLSFVLGLLGAKVKDPTSGFRIYGRRALNIYSHYYPYDYPEPESIAIAHVAGLRVVEEPVQMQARQGGLSSIRGLKTAYYMLKVTVAVLLSALRTDLRRFEIE